MLPESWTLEMCMFLWNFKGFCIKGDLDQPRYLDLWLNCATHNLNRKGKINQKKSDYLGVEVAADGLLSPRLVVKLCSSLLFWVPDHVSHCLWAKTFTFNSVLKIKVEQKLKKQSNKINVRIYLNIKYIKWIIFCGWMQVLWGWFCLTSED